MAMWPPSACLILLATILCLSTTYVEGAAPKGARFRELQLNQFLRSELSITNKDDTNVDTPTLIVFYIVCYVLAVIIRTSKVTEIFSMQIWLLKLRHHQHRTYIMRILKSKVKQTHLHSHIRKIT